MTMLTREQYLQWADALDSGKYIQQTRRFFEPQAPDNCGCCLNILCQLLDPEAERTMRNAMNKGEMYNIDQLYPEGRGWMSRGQELVFVGLNDAEGYTFPQIAQYIRTNIDTLAPLEP